jgi:hypothetical protein
MERQLPGWQSSRNAALTAWREALAPEDREAMAAAGHWRGRTRRRGALPLTN